MSVCLEAALNSYTHTSSMRENYFYHRHSNECCCCWERERVKLNYLHSGEWNGKNSIYDDSVKTKKIMKSVRCKFNLNVYLFLWVYKNKHNIEFFEFKKMLCKISRKMMWKTFSLGRDLYGKKADYLQQKLSKRWFNV